MNKEGVEINKSRVFSLARDQERNNDDYSILGPFQLLGLINSNKRPFNSPIVMDGIDAVLTRLAKPRVGQFPPTILGFQREILLLLFD